MRYVAVLLIGVCVGLASAGRQAAAQEWTRFRGPNGSGISEVATVPVKWGDADYNWKIELPGQGHSSPVLWGKRLFITSAAQDSGKRYVLCIDTADGRTVWTHELQFDAHKKHRNNTFASNTPVVDADRVYLLWQGKEASALLALDHTGREVWRRDMGRFKGGHGGAISPIVYEDVVIVGNDQEGPSSLLAFDRHSGKPRWDIKRRSTRATYSTPCIYKRKGGAVDIIFTDWQHGITGIDPKTGKQSWEIAVFGERKERAIGSPVVAGDLVIGTCGFVNAKKHLVAVRPERVGSEIQGRVIYRIERAVPHVPTVLAYRELLFLWTEKGIVTCVKAKSGEQVWQNRAGGDFHGSPVCVGGKLYCVSTRGVVVVIAASEKFEVLARNELGEPCRSTPAVAGGRMYLRTVSHLFSLGG